MQCGRHPSHRHRRAWIVLTTVFVCYVSKVFDRDGVRSEDLEMHRRHSVWTIQAFFFSMVVVFSIVKADFLHITARFSSLNIDRAK